MATKKDDNGQQDAQALQQKAATGEETPPKATGPVTPSHNPPDPQNLGEGRPANIVPEAEQKEAVPEGAVPETTQNPDGQRPQDAGVAGTGPYDPTAPRRPAESPAPVKAEGAAEEQKKALSGDDKDAAKAAGAQVKASQAQPGESDKRK